MPRLNIVGKRFGRLVVSDRTAEEDYKAFKWMCVCDCGNEKVVAGSSLKSGATKSCGCYKLEVFPASLKERFERQFIVTPGCWIWNRAYHPTGYGHFTIKGIPYRAHRISYELYCGPIPEGLLILHSCDNPKCVNPDHLRPGTHRENTQDMIARKRGNYLLGESTPNAKLNRVQVRMIYADQRAQRIVAADYGITRHHVYAIKARRTWAHLDMNASE